MVVLGKFVGSGDAYVADTVYESSSINGDGAGDVVPWSANGAFVTYGVGVGDGSVVGVVG